MAETTAQLQAKLKALTGGKVDILLDKDTFKNTTQILREMSEVWDEMSDMEQAAALELIGGKRQANILSSLIKNFETVEEVIESSMNSSGSAMAENAKWMDSIAGKSEQLTNAMQALWNKTLNSDVIKYFIDVGLGITEIVDKIGLIPTALAGALTYLKLFKKISPMAAMGDLFKSVNMSKNSYASMYTAATQIKNITKSGLGKFEGVESLDSTSIDAYAKAVNNLSAQQQAATLTSAGFSKAQAQQILMHNGVEDATIKEVLGLNTLNTTQQTSVAMTGSQIAATLAKKEVTLSDASATWLADNAEKEITRTMVLKAAATLMSKGATQEEILTLFGLASSANSASASVKGLTASIWSMMASNPIGWIMILISALTMLIPVIKDATKSIDEKIKDLNSKFQELENTIKTASEDFKTLKSSAEEVIPRFVELSKGVGQFGKNVSLTDEEYKEFLSLNNQIADMFPEINMGMDANGNAMLALSTTANTLEQSLWALVDAERAAANEEIAKTMPDVLTNIQDTVRQYEKESKTIETSQKKLKQAYQKFLNGDYTYNGAISDYQTYNLFDQLGIEYEEKILNTSGGIVGHQEYEVTFDPSISKEQIRHNYENAIAGINKEIENVNDKISKKWKQLNPIVTAWTQTDFTYQSLSDEMQNVVQAMIGNIDFAASGLDTQFQVENYIKNNIINKIDTLSADAQEKFSNLMSLDANGMTTQEYIDEINRIATAIEEMNEGWSAQDVLKNTGYDTIIKQYEKTVNNIADILGEGLDKNSDDFNTLKKNLYSFEPSKLTKAFDIIKKYGIKTWEELTEVLENKTFDVVLDYTAESESFEALQTAIEESTSALGLSSESIQNLQKRYQDLDSYDPAKLFERTEHGIHLNVKALRELEAEYAKQNTEDLNNKLKGLTEQYNKLTKEIDECSDSSETAELYSQRDAILDQINDTAELAAQYAGLTSAYYKWQKAQEGGNERDMYEGIISGRESMDELMSRGWVDDEVRAYVDLLSGKDLSTASVDEVLAAYKELNQIIGNSGYTIYDFFTTDEDGNSTTDGLFNFFDTVRSELGETYAWIDESGKYHLDFGIGGDKDVANKLKMDVEAVQALMRAASDAGFDVNLDSMYSAFNYLKTNAEEANDKLKELGLTTSTFNFNTDDVKYLGEQIKEAEEILKKFKNEDGTVNIEANGAEEAQKILATLLSKKQQLTDTSAILNIDVSGVTEVSSEIDQAVKLLQDFKKKYQEYEIKVAVGADTTETESELNAYLAQMQQNSTITGTLNIDPTSKEAAVNSINALTPEVIANILPDDTAIKAYDPNEEAKNALVTYGIDPESEVFRWSPPDKKGTIYYTVASTLGGYVFDKIFGGKQSNVDGTAHVSGTAFVGGSWGAPRTETALTGELGPEILVRDGRWHTIGENGAEFTQIKKGDIIFNHKQSEELLSKGYVTSRGKAYAHGTAYSNTEGGVGRNTVISAHIAGGGSSRLDDSIESANDAANDFAETFDWIEVRLEEINEQLDLMNAQLENADDVASKNNIIDQMIGVNTNKMANLTAGIKKYSEYAAKLLADVPAQYREAAQDGAIAISEFVGEADEKTLEAINNYRDWAQKVANLKQELEGVITTLRELAIQKIDNAEHSGAVRADIEDLQTQKLQNAVDYDELKGLIANPEHYGAMMENSERTIAYLTSARNRMQAAFDEAVRSGTIEYGSDTWYEELAKLYNIDADIDKAVASLEEYQNAINNIYWDNFDEAINRLGYISNETQNLIELMEGSDMFTKPDDDKGWGADDVQWTDEGITTLGLHAQEMQRAEEEAKLYGIAIGDLTKAYNAGLYSENEYLEKLDELQGKQSDAIKRSKDEKDAIVELHKQRVEAIKEGIEKEIEAYSELIEEQKEQLSAEKDLYDFQKGVMNQQKNIADIERQLAALANDNSMSAIAKRKELEAELAEANSDLQDTYYERSVEDKQTALDKELESFTDEKEEEIKQWENYLTNVETLIGDSFAIVQENAGIVYDTLTGKATEYGLKLSDAVYKPWTDTDNAIGTYTTTFGDTMSATTGQLDTLKSKWSEVKGQIDAVNSSVQAYLDSAAKIHSLDTPTVKEINKENANYGAATYTPSVVTPTPTPTTPSEPQEPPKPSLEKGSYVEVKPGTKWYADSYGGGASGTAKAGTIKAINTNGSHAYNIDWLGWVKKTDIKGYAKGTKNLKKSGLVNVDELGEELILSARNGRLTYLEKGSGVIPADITSNLMSWGALNPQEMLDRNRPQIVPNKNIVNTEINIDCSVGELVHIEHCDQDTLPDVEKMVNKAFEKHVQKLNNSLKRYTRG